MTLRDELIDAMRTLRSQTVRRFGNVEPAQLDRPVPWRGAASTLRFRLAALAEADDALRGRLESLAFTAGNHPSTAQRALATLGTARGALEGALCGVPDSLYSRPPGAGEWHIDRTLAHVTATDQRYIAAVRFACERELSGRGGPLRPPADSLPPPGGESQDYGTTAERLARLRGVRDEICGFIGSITENLLDAPTNWVTWDLDVRFRIYRFAAHDREHTIQIRKSLHALGFHQNELQLLLADAAAARGGVEGALLRLPASLLVGEGPAGTTLSALLTASLDEEAETLELGSR